mmetsp:Transcript_73457/g.159027  ORF Transcript_73457/g.159027 Transcript_73457/m.159027 type:complete len:229 (+) Transcript_73457:2-688(+)
MNFWQLSSIHPRSAFVTRTTVPCCFARRSVSMATLATSRSCSRCHAFTSEPSSRRRPWHWTHVEGRTVSSQSKMRTVSSRENLMPSAAAAQSSPAGSLALAGAGAAAAAWCCTRGGCCGCAGLPAPSVVKAGCSSDGISSRSSSSPGPGLPSSAAAPGAAGGNSPACSCDGGKRPACSCLGGTPVFALSLTSVELWSWVLTPPAIGASSALKDCRSCRLNDDLSPKKA